MLFFIAPILCSLLGVISLPDDDNDLPIYLQGIGWRNVEKELRKDLYLTKSVHPIHYDLYLNVAVGGYNNAERSTFNGTVSITVNITAPVREIEFHSLGLTIRTAKLRGSDMNRGKGKQLDTGKFQIRPERETVAIPSKRLLLPGETIAVIIDYSGRARMDGSGFYESWNQRENSSNLPYISLLSHCEPSRSRRWFPCFDEPDKKATFQLHVIHPVKTNAYSNTPIISSSRHDSTRMSHFATTVLLPTYLFALAITEQPMVEYNEDGYEFRAIGHNREEAVRTAAEALRKLTNQSIFDRVPFFPEKTDFLVVDDYRNVALENPGLITIDFNHPADFSMHTHELAHMYFGNLVTLSTWGDVWLNEGFAALFEKNLKPSSTLGQRSKDMISLHDLPLHSENNYYASIHLYNSFEAHIHHIHYGRASQFLRMIRKFVGASTFDRAINKYLIDNAFGNGDATKMVHYLVEEYEGDKSQLKTILYEWIYQPGIALLFLKRKEDQVLISQTRLTSSFFDEILRDEHTRFTIPLFCVIDGVSRTIVFDSSDHTLSIPLASNSTFTIENDYGELFGIWAAPSDFPDQFDNIDDWLLLTENLFRSGIIDVESYSEAVAPLVEHSSVKKHLQNRIVHQEEVTHDDRQAWTDRMAEFEPSNEGILQKSVTWMFEKYLRRNTLSVIFCYIQSSDRKAVKELLHDKIITDELKIRSIQLEDVIKSIEQFHPGAAMEFAMEELLRDPYSLPLRLRMKDIISAVFSISNDFTTLQDFIRLHPSIAAESADTIMQILEKKYIEEEFERKDQVLDQTIKTILNQ